VLAATDPAALKLLVTFGSIIGRAGLRGEAHYSTANDWLTDLTRKVGEDYPNCRTVALEWSVWSGAGMGERLGVLESLIREGISPIPTEDGIAILEQVLADPNAPTALVVMGRAEGLPTITLEEQELPLLRFLDRPQVHYPDIELVVDSDLTGNGDLYLPDHLLDGDLLFPAVIGMEAMTQAAQALTGLTGAPVLENVEFLRPIVVPVDGSTTIRVAVLATAPGVVQAAIRSGETDFQADHFRATLRFNEGVPVDHQPVDEVALIPLDPAEELYGPVLFQGLRFQRLVGYRRLAAKACVAQIANQSSESWFSSFQPQDLVLADPGTRDALMHSIQCNVPDATLLPAGIEKLYLADPDTVRDLDEVTLHANERSRTGDTYIYDLDVRDAAGNLVERWQGLKLQAVRKLDGAGPWQPVLLGPYLERRTETVLPAWLSCVVRPDEDEADQSVAARRTRTSEAIGWALGRETEVRYRPDGRPEVSGGIQVSASHGAGVTFAVTSVDSPAIACDVEVATVRPADEWARLLGPDQYALAQLVARERGEELSLAATRVWGAVESLRKVGHASIEAVTAGEPRSDRWVVFRAGKARIATFHTTLRDVVEPVVFTMLTEGDG
jgi:enediyne polyketide synthase